MGSNRLTLPLKSPSLNGVSTVEDDDEAAAMASLLGKDARVAAVDPLCGSDDWTSRLNRNRWRPGFRTLRASTPVDQGQCDV